jgi:hypothetical protein
MVPRALAGGSVKVALKVSGLVRTAFYWSALAAANERGMDFQASVPAGNEAQAKGRLFACLVLRDLVNPFLPIAPDAAHLSPTALSLARAAYDERHLPSGELDPVRLAVLADALEEAGAPGELVAHLRGPGPHTRGCWGVDLALGLS